MVKTNSHSHKHPVEGKSVLTQQKPRGATTTDYKNIEGDNQHHTQRTKNP